jgi:hypothetical protein
MRVWSHLCLSRRCTTLTIRGKIRTRFDAKVKDLGNIKKISTIRVVGFYLSWVTAYG